MTLALLMDAATLGLGIAAGPIFRTYDRTDLPIRTSIVILLLGFPATYLMAELRPARSARRWRTAR